MIQPPHQTPLPPGPNITFWEVVKEKSLVIFGLGLLAFLSIYGLEHFRPGQSNANLSGIIMAVFIALLAYLKSEQSHLTMNQRMSQWMVDAEAIAENRGYAKALFDLEAKSNAALEAHVKAEREAVLNRAVDAALVIKTAEDAALLRAKARPSAPTPSPPPASPPVGEVVLSGDVVITGEIKKP